MGREGEMDGQVIVEEGEDEETEHNAFLPWRRATYSTSPGFLFLSLEDAGLALQARIRTTAPGW